MMKKSFTIIVFVFMMLYGLNTQAQTVSYVQSRFTETDGVSCGGSGFTACQPAEAGLLLMRFKPNSIAEPNSIALTDEGNRFQFTIQFKKTGDSVRYLNTARFNLQFNNSALGSNLDTPPLFLNVVQRQYNSGTPNSEAQCRVTRGDLITGQTTEGFDNYATFFDNGGPPDELILELANANEITGGVSSAPASGFSQITNRWQDLITLSCMIPPEPVVTGKDNKDNDAGLVFVISSSEFRDFPVGARTADIRTALALANNDYQGFRLDGKTWVEDYTRYGDGKGVRLKFSKPILTELQKGHFSLDVNDDSIIDNVIHTSGSRYANVEFTQAVDGKKNNVPGQNPFDVLRITTQTTITISENTNISSVIRDAEGETLAPGNFVASLFHDTGAPTATNVVSSRSRNEHTISFRIPIRVPPAGNANDYLCVTEENGLCVPVQEDDDDPLPTIPITITASTQVAITTSTQLTFAFEDIPDTNELNSPFKRGGERRSIEFRRNAVFGETFRVVEDYQTELRDALVIPDAIGAEIEISNVRDTRDDMEAASFTITFDVESDEPVPNLVNRASYNINVMGINAITTPTSVTPLTGTGTTQVRVVYTVDLGDRSVSDIRSYTLNIVPGQLRDLGMNDPFFASVQRTLSSLSCASFYPNIGQRTLYFELDENDFEGTLTIGGLEIENPSISRNFSVDIFGDNDPDGEITSDRDITAVYTTSDGVRNEATCMAELRRDMDQDGVPDIVDSSPFNVAVATLNPETTGGADRAFTPSRRDGHFSRETVIRSLIGEGEFTFVDPDFSGKQTFERISSDEYFGINTNDDTQIFRYGPSKGECEMVLDEALEYNLNKVKIDEFCQDNRVFSFANESPRSNQEYIWVTVVDEILQVSTTSTEITTESGYFGYNLSVLPEINFSGQSSYIFAEATTATVFISAFLGDETANPMVRVRTRSSNPNNSGGQTDLTLTVLESDDPQRVIFQNEIVNNQYTIASPNSPMPGETIVHWLQAGQEANIWVPTSATISLMEGGRNLSSFNYAIGPNNNIDVRVAGSDDPEITRIRQIVLYDIDESKIVSSVIAGRSYYVIADYDTNIENGIPRNRIVANPMLVSGYTISETSATQLTMRTSSLSFTGEHQEAIEIMVNSEATTGTITAGWSEIGNISNIRAIYLVSPTEPNTYNIVDASDSLFTRDNFTETTLPVDTGRGPRNVDVLRAHAGNEQAPLPVFFTHIGLINADNEGGRSVIDYSAANIAIGESRERVLRLTEITGSEEAGIRSFATFGVSNVEYGFETDDNDQIEITGGVVYVTFPITTDDIMDIGPTLYIAKYGSRDDRSVGDSAAGNTWYAIKRTEIDQACPTDLQFYINNHQPAGNDGMGFEASADNCIMLVIADDSIYDASGQDGIIIDPIGISDNPMLSSPGEVLRTSSPGWYGFARRSDYMFTSMRTRGGGGGAIGTSDALLLVGALVLLLIGTASRRRRTLHNS